MKSTIPEVLRPETGPPDAPAPNLESWQEARRTFSWQQARARLGGLPGGGLNMAWEAIDRQVEDGRGSEVALRHLDPEGGARELTFEQLRSITARVAGGLGALGISPGDRVFTLSHRRLELYLLALGALRSGAVLAPLFAAFGPEPIRERIERGRGRLLATTASVYRRKVAPIRDRLEELEHVVLLDDVPIDATLPFSRLLEGEEAPPAKTDDDAPALLHFTSGTTGPPKGALHGHGAIVAQRETARTVLDLRPGDRYWCTADPGWVTGTVYGMIAPLAAGATLLIDETDFQAERWLRLLGEEAVDVWYTAPTAIRLLRRLPREELARFRFPRLRLACSVGEPLDAPSVLWGREVLGVPLHDTWWQTETGAIMIANYRAEPIKPGSMGRPVPGIEAAVVTRDGKTIRALEGAGERGELALREGWPSMFRDYVGDEARYHQCFADGWYLTGDLAHVDEDGFFWFHGRADDLIQSAGHRIGPTEVEGALLTHPAVLEAGVVGLPDPVFGERVKAYVSVRAEAEAGPELERELLAWARTRLGPAVAPREIEIRSHLPKTRSGKIMRRYLRAQELGEAPGDLSTLLPDSASTPEENDDDES